MKNCLPHIVGWMLFIAYELSFIWYSTGLLSGFTDYLIHYLLNIALFYSNSLFVLPYCSKKADVILVFWFTFLVLAELLLFITLKYTAVVLVEYFSIRQTLSHTNIASFSITTFFRGVYFVGLSSGYWMFRQTVKQKTAIYRLEQEHLRALIDNQELDKELLRTQNDFLRSQINPHLLFNSLNFIYNIIAAVNNRAAEMILRLSHSMRYALEPIGHGAMVALQDEIDNVQNYIELYQLKSDHKLNLEVSFEGDFTDHSISPVILLPLVENVFKYAELHEPGQKAKIHIHCINHTLSLYIKNFKNKVKNRPGYGIGLSNVLYRLDKIYKRKHQINILEGDDTYMLNLSLQLK